MKNRALTVVASLIMLLALHGLALTQEARLVDAAKEEGGKVAIYGSLDTGTMDLIAAALKKQAGLGTEYWRAAADKCTVRVAYDVRPGRRCADVIMQSRG